MASEEQLVINDWRRVDGWILPLLVRETIRSPNRVGLEMVYLILNCAQLNMRKSHILYEAHTSHHILQRYLDFLTTWGFLEEYYLQRVIFYRVTVLGLRLLALLNDIVELMEDVDHAR